MTPRVPSGCRPLSRIEWRALKRANDSSERPSINLQRALYTIERLESELARLRAPPTAAAVPAVPPTAHPPMPTTKSQSDAAVILSGQNAAKRLLTRLEKSSHESVVGMSRDELTELVTRLDAIAGIAERLHLERATAGSLPADAFPGPVG